MTGSLLPPGSASCVLVAMICASKLPHGNLPLRVMVLRMRPFLLNQEVIECWRHHSHEGTHSLWENLQKVAFLSLPCYRGGTKYSSLPEDTETSHPGSKVKLSLDAESVGALNLVFPASKGSWLQRKQKTSRSSHLPRGVTEKAHLSQETETHPQDCVSHRGPVFQIRTLSKDRRCTLLAAALRTLTTSEESLRSQLTRRLWPRGGEGTAILMRISITTQLS